MYNWIVFQGELFSASALPGTGQGHQGCYEVDMMSCSSLSQGLTKNPTVALLQQPDEETSFASHFSFSSMAILGFTNPSSFLG